uniref:Small ribosomal subunit protein bS20 n=1 Tax=Thermogemmatispora argillosa TaxID=2045280 RepID=A0A455T2W3_9CHLR|nr:30S ribosomal protein S20 [Thermogemmatispora argillosa]
MPNTKSAEKRLRQERKRRLYNRSVKSSVKTAIKKARLAIASGLDAEAAVRNAISTLDRAVKKGVLHPNNAARRKSRLMKLFNSAKAASSAQQASTAS